jgi:hypothetical protein
MVMIFRMVCRKLDKLLFSLEVILEPHDVVFFEVVAYLALDEMRRNFPRVFEAVGSSCRNEGAFALFEDAFFLSDGDFNGS